LIDQLQDISYASLAMGFDKGGSTSLLQIVKRNVAMGEDERTDIAVCNIGVEIVAQEQPPRTPVRASAPACNKWSSPKPEAHRQRLVRQRISVRRRRRIGRQTRRTDGHRDAHRSDMRLWRPSPANIAEIAYSDLLNRA
jgi:hypothetical protein